MMIYANCSLRTIICLLSLVISGCAHKAYVGPDIPDQATLSMPQTSIQVGADHLRLLTLADHYFQPGTREILVKPGKNMRATAACGVGATGINKAAVAGVQVREFFVDIEPSSENILTVHDVKVDSIRANSGIRECVQGAGCKDLKKTYKIPDSCSIAFNKSAISSKLIKSETASLRAENEYYEALYGWGLNGYRGRGNTKKVSFNKPLTSPLKYDVSMMEQYKSDVKGLYKAWISPHKAKGSGIIHHSHRDHRSSSEKEVKHGFRQFCKLSEGFVKTEKTDFGDSYKCFESEAQKKLIGSFSTERWNDTYLYVNYDTPQTIEAKRLRLEAYNLRKQKNGPTGTITTKDGTFKFIRVGDLRSRAMIEYSDRKTDPSSVLIEDVSRIDVLDGNRYQLTLRDGRSVQSKERLLNREKFDSLIAWTISMLPFVVRDSGRHKSKTFDEIQSIEFDDESSWTTKRNGYIR